MASRQLALANSVNSAFDPAGDSFGPQLRFLRDTSLQRAVCTSRRAGKTSAFVRDALYKSWTSPNTTVVYLNETRDRAGRTFWEEIKKYAHDMGLPYTANEAKYYLHGPENRWIHVSGGENKKQVSRWKGVLPKASAFYIDEAQDWRPEVLLHAYTEVISPALADIGGCFTVGGVPGPIPDINDTWYKWTQSKEFSQHGSGDSANPWTIWDNPHIKSARELIRRECDTLQVDESDPHIQREFYGRWVKDGRVLVFGALDSELNVYDTLPEGNWSFTAGIDFGYVDSSAITVLGWCRDADPRIYVISNEEFAQTGAYETIERIKKALTPLGPRLMVAAADPAAGGKNICHDLFTRHGLPVEPATKDDKAGAIKLMAASVASRELVVPRNHPLLRDMLRVRWDPEHVGEKLDGHTPDRVDSLLYAFRAAWPHYSYRLPEKPKTYEEQRLDRILQKQSDIWS